MNISANKWPAGFPFPELVRTIICCDVDETYIPAADENKKLGGVSLLESFIDASAEKKGFLIGWITGTNVSSAWRKAKGYISRSPHFICCSLGTEFYWIKDGLLCPSASWSERIRVSGYSTKNVDIIVNDLLNKRIALCKQQQDYQGLYQASYYYRESPSITEDFDCIQRVARERQVRAVFSRCNPAAGDPSGCYDVVFIPSCCGKDKSVSFLMEETGLSKEAVIAFGDSANDFPMFASAGKGYLVANADRIAVAHHGSCLEKTYCHGILSVLKEL